MELSYLQTIVPKNKKNVTSKTTAKKPAAKKSGVAALDEIIDNADWIQKYGEGDKAPVYIAGNVIGSRRPLTARQIAFVLDERNTPLCARIADRFYKGEVKTFPDN